MGEGGRREDGREEKEEDEMGEVRRCFCVVCSGVMCVGMCGGREDGRRGRTLVC
jgi:hypothetical protein